MSSLSDQLAQVATNNASVAFDRKKRQKLHSASLIYNPKTAATQDYEIIYENAVNALQELCDIEPRFEIFSKSLFQESSINIDRNVQSKEDIKNLDNAINAYLLLVSSKWHLAPALHATEWLVRRFQIHVHNTEILLLSTLNYYQTPIFKRILNIVKLPALFQPLSNFVKNDNLPTNMTIIKMFNDFDFLKLYTQFLSKCIRHKSTYTNQMLFVSCSLINLIAFNSNNEEKLESMIPILLELSAKLLASGYTDCQIAAHTILAVFASALSLKKEIVTAAIETILANLKDEKAKKSAFWTIIKVSQTLKGNKNVDHLPANIYRLFEQNFPLDVFMKYLEDERTIKSDKFITSFTRAIIRYDQAKLKSLSAILESLSLEKFEVRYIITDLIHLSEIIDDKSKLIDVFEYLVKKDENLVLSCLSSLNLTSELFEIRLTTSLFSKSTEDDEMKLVKSLTSHKSAGILKESETKPFKEFLEKNAEHIVTSNISLIAEDDEKFNKMLSLFTEAIGNGYQAGLFLSSFITTIEAKLTFLLRIIVSPSAPIALRLLAMNNISKSIQSIDKDSNLFTLVPFLLVAQAGSSKNLKISVKKIISQISNRPSTKHYFLSDKLYGKDSEIALPSPEDSEKWIKNFLDNYMVENVDLSNIFIPKKQEKVFLVFWAQQVLSIPIPYPKYVILNLLERYTQSPASYSAVFEQFISSYLEQREDWLLKCALNKTNVILFESTIIDLISPKEKHQFMLDFIVNALNSDYEELIDVLTKKLATLFPTFKSSFQLKIIQTILESVTKDDQIYDSLGALQSLKIDAGTFVSILKENSLNSEGDSDVFPKRRRRRSSTNKAALQSAQVSQIAEQHLKKITIMLETLEKQKSLGTEILLTSLLFTLADFETLDQDGGLPVLYAEELLASCMLNTIRSLKEQGITQLKSIRADIIVSAIRTSSSPQVQNKLLLVIGELASLSSELILHSIMPIFTFMGAHSVRQDDEFTTQVVEKTILTIIPALLKANKENLSDEIEFLVISFTTALQHIPKHRRLRLFTTLIRALGPENSLGALLYLISQQYSNLVNSFKISESRSIIEFVKSLLSKFDIESQIHGIQKYFEIFNELLEANKNPEKKVTLETQSLYSNRILNFTQLEFYQLLINSYDFLNKIIIDNDNDYFDSNRSFRIRLYSVLLDQEIPDSEKSMIERGFGEILESVLYLINSSPEVFMIDTESTIDTKKPSGSISDSLSEISSSLLTVLQNLLSVLPMNVFLKTTIPMLESSANEDIRFHVASIIGNKFDEETVEEQAVTSEVVNKILERIPKESEHTKVSQVLLNTLSLLVNKYGSHLDTGLLMNVLHTSTDLIKGEIRELQISSLAVVTNAIGVLGVKFISFYPKIVPRSIQLFALSKEKSDILTSQLQLSILLLFTAMIKSIPSFLVSNLADLLRIIFFADDIEITTRLSVIQLISEKLDLKATLKVMLSLWESDVCKSQDPTPISLFLSLLEATVEKIDKKSATSQSPTFFKLLICLFEYRCYSTFDKNTISRIEASAHTVANAYVLKMNDKVFRPLFVILVKWAFDGEGVRTESIDESERLIAFFKFFNKLQENLRGIITSYFTYLIEPTNELLKRFISGDFVDINLRRLVVNSLTSSFKYDRDEYWQSSSRFELICPSLVDQLRNIEPSIGKYLVKAIGSLAANNSSVDEHNQIMNKLLVEHMKSTCSSNEKLWAVKTVKLIYSKVGENWLVLLPQMVPIIAELLEDDNEEVESEVRGGLVRVMENVLGEPFDRYLD
ncbi:U3 small nucleolar RNA-associated protein 10 [Nakaseomyces bracarensis]|uniref:U3 small nucleolar RNA-associated protein 10 n=1 Tax=Nakaseomyces bracarensis TaxID=273131 RepID=A0ABR4NV15_9SACH